MWTKFYADGSIIQENKRAGATWLKTPLKGIVGAALTVMGPQGSHLTSGLKGHEEYWHSRTVVANDSCKPIIVAERIQGRMPDGTWETITWTGSEFKTSVENRAIGRPVV